ncbi:sulfatase [Parapedobacter sp. 2B3]|uniref:sulfatase n=1 Tax=Parapedobacter sp. 2B3 TaxID=3342381 RepID=UPI0035B58D87
MHIARWCSLLLCLLASPAMGQQPNILFIAVDDLRPQLACYGDRVAITPHTDRLAQRGVVFNRAYCQQAVCAPSRASVLTGRRPDATRVWDLKTHFRAALPHAITLPQYFKVHGYEARSVGKIYHDPANAQDRISWSAPEVMAVTGHAGPKYVRSENLAGGTSWKAAATECADVPDSAYVDGKVADAAVQLLRELKDTAFFLAVGFRRPHLPFSAPKRYWDLYQTDAIPLPWPDRAPLGAPAIALHTGVELRGYTDMPDAGPLPPGSIRELRHGYYAGISYIDAQIGKLLDELERLGLLQNTLIVLWSDHGFHLGELGLWCKTTNFETDTRVPLIISSPLLENKAAHSDALVELVDIYPTLLELAGLPIPDDLDGTSMAPLIAEPGRDWKKAAFSQFPRPWMYKAKPEVMGYSVRIRDYRYTEWRNMDSGVVVDSELYHYGADDIEHRNLAGNPDFRATEKSMKQLLDGGWKQALPSDN